MWEKLGRKLSSESFNRRKGNSSDCKRIIAGYLQNSKTPQDPEIGSSCSSTRMQSTSSSNCTVCSVDDDLIDKQNSLRDAFTSNEYSPPAKDTTRCGEQLCQKNKSVQLSYKVYRKIKISNAHKRKNILYNVPHMKFKPVYVSRSHMSTLDDHFVMNITLLPVLADDGVKPPNFYYNNNRRMGRQFIMYDCINAATFPVISLTKRESLGSSKLTANSVVKSKSGIKRLDNNNGKCNGCRLYPGGFRHSISGSTEFEKKMAAASAYNHTNQFVPRRHSDNILPPYIQDCIALHWKRNSSPETSAAAKTELDKKVSDFMLPRDPSDPIAFTEIPGVTKVPKPPICSSNPVYKIVGTFAILMSLGILAAYLFVQWYSNTFRPMMGMENDHR